ncbi:hypothetical protein Pcinc_038635 [Petrolisthes cinctipes]|uniref:Uncharacterized protein n=1 Tax=Petrolisthes cinctipes TaxID=88211 RepID=A0AAE1BQA1_PETCI|nr:hypothetical protein Pcinc_038635 [Petrolisthes cinctipes]
MSSFTLVSSPSRRGSSLSEQAENEVYQLARSYPHSLPQSRRSSVAYQSSSSLELKADELEARLSVSMSPLERRRSHSFRTATRSEFLQTTEDYVRPRRASFTPLIRSNSIKNSSQPDLWVRKGSCSSSRPDDDVRTWR